MIRKRSNGEGTIRKRANGSWEARISTPDGKRRSIYGSTRNQVREKMTALLAEVDAGDYHEPCQMTLEEWLKIWTEEYLPDIKPSAKERYEMDIRRHINPQLGSTKLSALTAPKLQKMLRKNQEDGLSPKSIKNLHGVIHKALEKAYILGYIKRNVSNDCELPRMEKKEMHTITDENLQHFMEALQDDREEYRYLFFVAIYTGMRQGELMGLTWDAVDFKRGTITVNKQLQRERHKDGKYLLQSTKTGRSRTFVPAEAVMETLKRVRLQQIEWQLRCGEAWQNTLNLVFTNETGKHLSKATVCNHFKRMVRRLGMNDVRFHDMRHTYATLALQNQIDIKTVSSTLGHSTVAFTMDVYAHVSDTMQRDSAEKMGAQINSVWSGWGTVGVNRK